jgi:hypothetical protein
MNKELASKALEGTSREPRQLEGFAWVADRLAAMSPAEIAFRFGEKFKREVSRFYHPAFSSLVTAPMDPCPALPGLADGLRTLVDEAELRRGWRREAEQMRQGRFRALGVTWPDHPGPPNWHLYPSTNTTWPNDPYCFDISYRYMPNRGDIKFVHELNRLQYLQPMAAAAALDDDDYLAALVVQHLESWMSSNPPYRGMAWLSGIELALRVVSLLVVSTLIGAGAFSAEFRQRLQLCLAAHGYWLARFPSRFSSANNHRIAEAGGLYLLGCLVPSLRHAPQWRSEARQALERELALQFHDDGVGAEQSPTYSAFSLEWRLLCATVGGQPSSRHHGSIGQPAAHRRR